MTSRFFRCLMVSVLMIFLTSCNQDEIIQKFAPVADQNLAKSYINHLRNKNFEEIEKVIDPSLKSENLRNELVQMSNYIPVEEPKNIKLVGAHTSHINNEIITNLTYEYEFSSIWIVTNVATNKKDGNFTIVGFTVNANKESLEKQNEFGLTGKSFIQYIVLLLVIIFPLLSLAALVVCIRTKLSVKKWPWILFIIFGFTNFSVSWTTGEWFYSLFAVQLFSASAMAPLYGNWILAVSLPIGALSFFMLKEKLQFVNETNSE